MVWIYEDDLERPANTPVVMVKLKANIRIDKFVLPVISLKTTTPQNEAISAGPVFMMGNDIGSERAEFATKKHVVAAAHMMPDARPGKMTLE